MTAPDALWAVTKIAHPALRDVRPDCEHCLALTETAISHAAVTGSVGATYSEPKDGEEHSVTVARAVTAVVRSGIFETPDITVRAADITRLVAPA